MASNKTPNMKMNSWVGIDGVLREEIDKNFKDIDSEIASRGINVKWFGVKGDYNPATSTGTDDSAAFQAAVNVGGTVIVPAGNYLLNGKFDVNGISNFRLIGMKGAKLYVDGGSNFFNILNSQNVEVSGISFIDKSYSGDVYFKEITLDPAAILTPNTNPNIDVTIVSPKATIAWNANTVVQTAERYSVTINLDNTKEHTLQTYDGLIAGENAFDIKIRKYTDAVTFQEYTLDTQNQLAGSPGQFRWHANYIETGIIKIELLLSYSKLNNSDNNPAVYDLSKIRLFQATKPLPGSVDTFNISIQNSKNVTICNNEVIGMKRQVFSTLGANFDLVYRENRFTNCFINHLDVANVTRCLVENNTFILNVKSDTGLEVFYTKAVCRAVRGNLASSDVTIRNNYGYGLYFGAEIWYSTNLFIDRFTLEAVQWGLSICNNSTGSIRNCTFKMRDNYRYVIELATGVKMDADNILVSGRSYDGLVFSLTSNTAGICRISNVKVESCFLFCQFTHSGVSFRNIEVKELIGIGIFGLQTGDYSQAMLTLTDCMFIYSNVLKINNPAYTASFIRTNSSTVYIDRIILRNCEFLGKPPVHSMDVRTTEIVMENVKTDSVTQWVAKIRLKDLVNKLSSVKRCQLYKFDFGTEFYATASNSKLVIADNKVSTGGTIPTHANVLTSNNITLV